MYVARFGNNLLRFVCCIELTLPLSFYSVIRTLRKWEQIDWTNILHQRFVCVWSNVVGN